MKAHLTTLLERLLASLSAPDSSLELVGWPGLPLSAQPPMCSAD